jgi:DNA-binding transcriptional LysR family regulator
MNWDDLRVIEAVSDEGSYAAAGVRLRIDETTVARRLARVERTLRLRLFEAVDGSRRPTADCERILAHVLAMSRHVAAIDKIGEGLPGPAGRFRIASTTVTAEEILAPRAGPFLVANPGIKLRFLSASENINFSRWEADLAIRLKKPEKGDFTISKLAELAFCLVEPEAEPDHGPPGSAPIICCYPPELDPTPESRYLAARGLQQHARCVTDNVRIIRSLIERRYAAGILPEYICGDLLTDKRLKVTRLPQRRGVWLLVQSHLKRDPAARLVIDWVRACFHDLSRA